MGNRRFPERFFEHQAAGGKAVLGLGQSQAWLAC